MCLNQVKNRLEGRTERYKSADDAAIDVRLIWKNCLRYNMPGTKIYSLALALSDTWESMYSATKLSTVSDSEKPPTIEDMMAFAEKCHRLTPEELGVLLTRLDQQGYASNPLVKRTDVNECEINVDLMTGAVFKEAMEFVSSCIPENEVDSKKRRYRDVDGGATRKETKRR
jgi:hypothetical protein